MSTGQKTRTPGGRNRINNVFKRRRLAPDTATSTTTTSTARARVTAACGDRERTRDRYREAARLLHEAVNERDEWKAFDFPELSGEPEAFNDAQFKDKIDKVLHSRNPAMKELSGWGKCTYAIQCAFAAFSPFAKNFLLIAKDAQAVYPAS